MSDELARLRILAEAVRRFIVEHNQRSDDPEFDELCEAVVACDGKDPRE